MSVPTDATDDVSRFSNETQLLTAFRAKFLELDAEVIVGYQCNGALCAGALVMPAGLVDEKRMRAGRVRDWSCVHRAVVDLWYLSERAKKLGINHFDRLGRHSACAAALGSRSAQYLLPIILIAADPDSGQRNGKARRGHSMER